jgi:transposase InsO family protein
VERSHRIDNEEFCRRLEGELIDDTEVFNKKLREWEDFSNYDRPHGSLGGQTPYERLKVKTATKTHGDCQLHTVISESAVTRS